MTNILRFIIFISLAAWLGGIIFFGAVLAPSAFAVLPSHTLAGMVVSSTLSKLHIIGFVAGTILVLATIILHRVDRDESLEAAKVALVVLMLVLTLYAQFGLGARMNNLRVEMGVIDTLPKDEPRRVEFNHLHVWSERLEQSVFFCGLVVLFLSSRRIS